MKEKRKAEGGREVGDSGKDAKNGPCLVSIFMASKQGVGSWKQAVWN